MGLTQDGWFTMDNYTQNGGFIMDNPINNTIIMVYKGKFQSKMDDN